MYMREVGIANELKHVVQAMWSHDVPPAATGYTAQDVIQGLETGLCKEGEIEGAGGKKRVCLCFFEECGREGRGRGGEGSPEISWTCGQLESWLAALTT